MYPLIIILIACHSYVIYDTPTKLLIFFETADLVSNSYCFLLNAKLFKDPAEISCSEIERTSFVLHCQIDSERLFIRDHDSVSLRSAKRFEKKLTVSLMFWYTIGLDHVDKFVRSLKRSKDVVRRNDNYVTIRLSSQGYRKYTRVMVMVVAIVMIGQFLDTAASINYSDDVAKAINFIGQRPGYGSSVPVTVALLQRRIYPTMLSVPRLCARPS